MGTFQKGFNAAEQQHVCRGHGVLPLSQQFSRDESKLLLKALDHDLVINFIYGDPVIMKYPGSLLVQCPILVAAVECGKVICDDVYN